LLKLLKYMKKSAPFIVLAIVFLVVQAFTELLLPKYTSDIVDVGIQRGGISESIPQAIRVSEMDKLLEFVSEEERETVLTSYRLLRMDMFNEDRQEYETNKYPILMQEAVYELKVNDENSFEKLTNILYAPMLLASGASEEMQDNTSYVSRYIRNEYAAIGIDVDRAQIEYIIRVGLRMLGLAFLSMFAAIFASLCFARIGTAFSRDVRHDIFSKIVSFSGAEFDRFSTASLITRSTNDVQQVQMFLTMGLRILCFAPITAVGGIVMVLRTNVSMSWIIVLAVAIVLGLVVLMYHLTMPKFKVMQKLLDRLNLVIREILNGLPVIRSFSAEKREEERFEKANDTLTRTSLYVNRIMSGLMPVLMLVMNVVVILIMWNGAHGIEKGSMQVGDLMAFIQYTMQIISSFLMISMISLSIPRASVASDRISEVFDTDISVENNEKTTELPASARGEIEFKDVSFRYPGAEEDILEHISFTARPGETTAIIGSTGCGKSTLVNLIPRLYDVTKGSVCIDGIDVRDLSLENLRNIIGFVPQKGVLFSGTIDSNLRFGKTFASETEIRTACDIAQASDFIAEREDGFESAIAQGGSNVSGGQKQRLAIARAIVKTPKIFVFDDSFSALDYKTDVTLRRKLKESTADATVVIVVQRISTILHAQQIIVLDDGKIVGMGTHKELLASCDVYRQIAASQLSKEELDR